LRCQYISTSMENIVTTKSVNLSPMKQVPKEFQDWLRSKMEERNWGIRETARRIGLSHPTISDIFNIDKPPSFETCLAIAQTFGIPSENVLRLAGLLPQTQEKSPQVDEISYLFDQLSSEEQEELIQLARFKIERRARKEHVE
jgi:transcriptional regulator with XRE-family HTH domain